MAKRLSKEIRDYFKTLGEKGDRKKKSESAKTRFSNMTPEERSKYTAKARAAKVKATA